MRKNENELEKVEPYQRVDLEYLQKRSYENGYSDAEDAGYLSGYLDGENKGLSDAWEFWKKLQNIVIREDGASIVKNIFDCRDMVEVLKKYSPQEAIEKLKAWEEEQEANVGDVIKSCNGTLAVIQYIDAWGMWQCFSKNGGLFTLDHEKQRLWKKTGKHIDLTEIFKGLEGENADSD